MRQPTHLTELDLVANREHTKDSDFRMFRHQLFHTSLSHILSSLRPAMSEPEVIKCGDGIYRHVVYGLGPYIANYPEQVLISGIVQGWCPRYSSTTTHFAQVIDTGLSATLQVYLTQGRPRNSRSPKVKGTHRRRSSRSWAARFVEHLRSHR